MLREQAMSTNFIAYLTDTLFFLNSKIDAFTGGHAATYVLPWNDSTLSPLADFARPAAATAPTAAVRKFLLLMFMSIASLICRMDSLDHK